MSNFERANDDWEHLAAMKSFAEAPLHPTHPYSFDTEYSHLFTPYHFFWGLVSRILNISPFFLSPFIGLINVLIFIISVQIFASKFLKDSNLASILLLTLMFLWFLAPGFSGYYQFSHLLKTAIYPYRLAFSLSLLTLAFYPIVTSHKRNVPHYY
ncbi:MAG: hypothetical protein IPG53_16030 [Ignavibacteriales bacterium]|nr:hypothetical protein [Ignavibacteriales bacterium]